MTKQIKTFNQQYPKDLDRNVNEFLKTLGNKQVKIKYRYEKITDVIRHFIIHVEYEE